MEVKLIRIGIICPSEIAIKRFLPSLVKLSYFRFVGVAIADLSEWVGPNDDIIANEKAKAQNFINQYGGKIFNSYKSIIESAEIDAIYLPLPPALHYKWTKLALLAGKHVLIEKPATTSFAFTKELLTIAEEKKLALHENYMFAFHKQIATIKDIIEKGEIGNVRLYRISFGFPQRALNDFRYNKRLGGGALFDCGGYTIKYASMLLEETAKIAFANLNYINDFEVDMYGSGILVNDTGNTIQISFGMDNAYKCDLEVWGSTGVLSTGRIFTAPAGFVPKASLLINNKSEMRKLPSDDAFFKSIRHFHQCIDDENTRKINYADINRQAKLTQQFIDEVNR